MTAEAKLWAQDLTPTWSGFCALWRHIGVHASVYGWAPDYRRASGFLQAGGFMSRARLEDFEP